MRDSSTFALGSSRTRVDATYGASKPKNDPLASHVLGVRSVNSTSPHEALRVRHPYCLSKSCIPIGEEDLISTGFDPNLISSWSTKY